MKTRSILVLAFAAVALAIVPTAAVADSATHTFLLEIEVPNVSRAPNGDQVAVTGEGDFQVHPKAVEAAGMFTHTDSEGNVLAAGTWTATQLLAYQSYGCGFVLGNEIPANLCGGKLKMRVTLTPEGTELAIPAVLTIFCIIGPNPPASHDDPSGEGVTLVVPGHANFNKIVSGMNVYIQTS
jgi:hypothetical protein